MISVLSVIGHWLGSQWGELFLPSDFLLWTSRLSCHWCMYLERFTFARYLGGCIGWASDSWSKGHRSSPSLLTSRQRL